ncbi:MAG: DUF3108 domain-containing protein, partial [Bacteroidota bacterium]|nr:DUF3108 domain-containing protein [Bacteroidota bacterium]
AFTFGEKISYKVRYNLYFNINVGEVTFEVKPKPEVIAGNSCYHISATGQTYSFYDNFYKVRDRYETFVETNSLLPLVFIRNVDEGGFKFSEHVYFNHKTKKAKSTKRTQSIPAFTQDVLSAIYYARTLDYDNAKAGQAYYLHAFIDDSAYRVGVKYMGRETVKTDFGSFKCIKLVPLLVVDRIFKSEDAMTMWVTDDANRVPVRIESGISVGNIRVDLYKYDGLRNTMTSRIK